MKLNPNGKAAQKAIRNELDRIGSWVLPTKQLSSDAVVEHLAEAVATALTTDKARADALEEAAKVAEDQYRDHPTVSVRAVNYRHAARRIAQAIRSLKGAAK